jgi:hypothetical protein
MIASLQSDALDFLSDPIGSGFAYRRASHGLREAIKSSNIGTQVVLGHANISRTALPRIHSLSLSDKLSAPRIQKRDSA